MAADDQLPQMLVTTSSAVVETLVEAHAETSGLKRLAEIRLRRTADEPAPLLGSALAALAGAESPVSMDLSDVGLPTIDPASEPGISVAVYLAADMTTDRFIDQLTPAAVLAKPPTEQSAGVRHTLIVLVGS
jgi:hypothetical protein